ncbi:efflux RND transporter permease subunit, partial [Vibrio parahaemolyticus]|nr:efflux RND transporter permease subunit [Vibrio parahaemolyticus]
VRSQNQQVAAGSLGAQPAANENQFQVLLNVKGRLENIDEFNDIVVKVDETGALTRLKDVARVELGQNSYALRALLNGKPAVAMPVFQRPGANAIELSNQVRSTMDRLQTASPAG